MYGYNHHVSLESTEAVGIGMEVSHFNHKSILLNYSLMA